MNLFPSILFTACLGLVSLAVFGCSKPPARVDEYRHIEFHILNDDPTGLYVLEITDEQAAAIDEENLQIDVVGNVCRIDRAFLKSAIPTFHHKGHRIGTTADPVSVPPFNGLRVWAVKREPREMWFYIGTVEQYAQDRYRPHQIGDRIFTF